MQTLEVEHVVLAEKRSTWFKTIEDFNVSGQTQIQFCKERNINKDQFCYYLARWRKMNISKPSTTPFQPVEVVKGETHGKYLLHFAPGLSLEFPEGVSLLNVLELILSLRKTLC